MPWFQIFVWVFLIPYFFKSLHISINCWLRFNIHFIEFFIHFVAPFAAFGVVPRWSTVRHSSGAIFPRVSACKLRCFFSNLNLAAILFFFLPCFSTLLDFINITLTLYDDGLILFLVRSEGSKDVLQRSCLEVGQLYFW